MLITKSPEKLNNITVDLPASKSISNRLLILNALSNSPYPIKNLSDCDDTIVLQKILNSNENRFDIGTAGTAMRFLTAYLSTIVGEWHLTGDNRMKQRPISILVEAINNLGGRIEYTENEGFPPLRIFGTALQGGEVEIQGNVSSQYISALLMIAPTMQKGVKIIIKGKISSIPYIYMTLSLMKQFGIDYSWGKNIIYVPACEYIPIQTTVESDWSAASYWFEIVALSKDKHTIFLKGLEKNSIQGDAIISDFFNRLGVKSSFTENGLRLERSGSAVKYFRQDFTNYPDLAQTIAVTCAFLNIPFTLTGLETLKIKETDRITALTTELRKFGFDIKTNNSDNLFWNGTKIEKQSNICLNSYNDHRMVMSFAPAALKTEPFEIDNPDVVLKSYPGFWEDLGSA